MLNHGRFTSADIGVWAEETPSSDHVANMLAFLSGIQVRSSADVAAALTELQEKTDAGLTWRIDEETGDLTLVG